MTVKQGTTQRDCPRCKKSLTAVLLGIGAEQLELDRCTTCHGLFFDPGELDAVLDGIETRAQTVDHRQLLTLIEDETPGAEEVAYVPCPDCGQLMHRRNFGQRSGVIADSCRDHGLWLDGGELRRLIRWTQAGGRRHQAAQETEKQKAEAKLQQMPSTVPTTSWSEQHSQGGSGTFFGSGGVFDALDVVDLLGSLIRVWR